MKTHVYPVKNKLGTQTWWWAERKGTVRFINPHGPFYTRDEAFDASRAARITRKYEDEQETLRSVGILAAG